MKLLNRLVPNRIPIFSMNTILFTFPQCSLWFLPVQPDITLFAFQVPVKIVVALAVNSFHLKSGKCKPTAKRRHLRFWQAANDQMVNHCPLSVGEQTSRNRPCDQPWRVHAHAHSHLLIEPPTYRIPNKRASNSSNFCRTVAPWDVARTFRVRFPDKLLNLRTLESSAELGTESESALWHLHEGPTPKSESHFR